jgi:prophage endopeptidase
MKQAFIGLVVGLLLTALWHWDRTNQNYAGFVAGKAVVQGEWDAEKLKQSEAARESELERVKISNDVQRKHDDEINKLRADLSRSERLRVGTAICGTSTTSESNPASSDTTGAGGRLLSEEMDRDIKSLILETEQIAATARACQAVLLTQNRSGTYTKQSSY